MKSVGEFRDTFEQERKMRKRSLDKLLHQVLGNRNAPSDAHDVFQEEFRGDHGLGKLN